MRRLARRVLVALGMLGVLGLVFWKVGSDRAERSADSLALARAERKSVVPKPVDETRPPMPWAAGAGQLAKREYRALVANARNDPKAGTLGLAHAAVAECLLVAHPGYVERAVQKIETGPREVRARRLAALEKLRAPCESLGDFESLREQNRQLWSEAQAARDAYHELNAAHAFLQDKSIERASRQAKLVELMGMNDPTAMGVVVGALTREGASLDGELLPMAERAPYFVAWIHIMCDTYQGCFDPESTRTLRDCVNHAECEGIDFASAFARALPWFLPDKVPAYYRRIQAHLDRGRFSAFGVP